MEFAWFRYGIGITFCGLMTSNKEAELSGFSLINSIRLEG